MAKRPMASAPIATAPTAVAANANAKRLAIGAAWGLSSDFARHEQPPGPAMGASDLRLFYAKFNGLAAKRQSVITITSSHTGPRYIWLADGKFEEVPMVALAKQTKSRLVRWFKEFKERNRPPHKWYEHDHYGI